LTANILQFASNFIFNYFIRHQHLFMKKIFILTFCAAFIGTICFAQHTEVELIRSAFKLDKKAKVAQFMQLPDSTAKKFWPIYNQYEAERSKLGDRKVKLLELYSNTYFKVSNAEAEKMWKESTSIQRAEAALREKYAGIVKTKISAPVALNFYMIEDYINTAVKQELYSAMPAPNM